jgi:hypothetical protein
MFGLGLLGALHPLAAGGVFYNSNQSAEYLRTFERNSAVDGADLVYYNMAGAVRLPEGLTLNLSNQTIFQRATVATLGNPVLGDRTYRSTNPAWVVPNLYGAYRTGRVALFMGLETIGATAIRTWPSGLPNLDLLGRQRVGYGGAASMVMAGDAYAAALQAGRSPAQAQAAALAGGLDASTFEASSWLKGSSRFLAWRGGAACQVSPAWSLALALRVVAARQELAGQVDAQATYNQAGHDLRQQARLLLHRVDRATGGSGELSLNAYPAPGVVFSFTFEMATPLTFRTAVQDGQDGGGLIPDGKRARLDLPMALRSGLGWQATPRLRASLGVNAYLEQSADLSMLRDPANATDPARDYGNTFEEGLALEYRLTPAWLVSGGLNFNQIGQRRGATLDLSLPGAHEDYVSVGAGFRYALSRRFQVNVGLAHTRFRHPFEHADVLGDQALQARFADLGQAIQPRKRYDKRFVILALGLECHFGR